jgi:hypothetical protein
LVWNRFQIHWAEKTLPQKSWLSFTPGFSPVLWVIDLPTVLTVLLPRIRGGSKPLKRFTLQATNDTGLKPGVNERKDFCGKAMPKPSEL